jgi:hypothetical protein
MEDLKSPFSTESLFFHRFDGAEALTAVILIAITPQSILDIHPSYRTKEMVSISIGPGNRG